MIWALWLRLRGTGRGRDDVFRAHWTVPQEGPPGGAAWGVDGDRSEGDFARGIPPVCQRLEGWKELCNEAENRQREDNGCKDRE
jgi:hypothetical protein